MNLSRKSIDMTLINVWQFSSKFFDDKASIFFIFLYWQLGTEVLLLKIAFFYMPVQVIIENKLFDHVWWVNFDPKQ